MMEREKFMQEARLTAHRILEGKENGIMNLVQQAWAEGKRAAEHPEPKYPTWIEWLEEIGVAGRLPSTEPVFTENQEFYLRKLGFTPKADNPIPADIAEKLGIEPKEM